MKIGNFLESNPTFTFHPATYIESLKYSVAAKQGFRRFRRAFRSPFTSNGDYWRSRRGLIRSTLERVPAYSHMDWAADGFWNGFSLIDKQALRVAPDEFLNQDYERADLWCRPTSGTTGPPVGIMHAPEFYFEHLLFSTLKVASIAGVAPRRSVSSPVFIMDIYDNKYLSDRVWATPDSVMGLILQVVFDESNSASRLRLTQLLNRHCPDIVSVRPNTLETFVRSGDSCLAEAIGKTRLITCGGADLDPDLRGEAQRLFSVQVCNAYALSEFGLVAAECEKQMGLHLFEHDHIAEVLRDDGTLSDLGYGELVLSSTVNRAMPLMRFKTGDIVEVTSAPCPCQRQGRRISRLCGRRLPNFMMDDLSEFSPTTLNRELFADFPIREFQITQSQIGNIEVAVEFLPSCTSRAAEIDCIQDYLEMSMRKLSRVRVREATFQRVGKFERYKQLLKSADIPRAT